MSNIIHTLKSRGLLAQMSHMAELEKTLSEKSVTFYVGFDPTADSLHVGHLTSIMTMYYLSQAGHTPICILGGGTAMVGDPSGKTEMRNMMSQETIEVNRVALETQFKNILKIKNLNVLNNADWLLPLNYLDFMRDYGVHFKVNEMLKYDIYRDRLGRDEGLTIFELNYLLLQSYDFLYLNRTYGCVLEIGGSDQWANILGGVSLTKKCEGREVYALTWPLLTRSDGKKMGKSEGGAVWLDSKKTSPYDLYQYFINVPDADVRTFLLCLTTIHEDEIHKHVDEDIRNAKHILAHFVTSFVHGKDEADKAKSTSVNLFASGESGEALTLIEINKTEINNNAPIVSLLVIIKAAVSNREAREHLQNGAVSINQEVVRADYAPQEGAVLVVRVGKKKFYKVKII